MKFIVVDVETTSLDPITGRLHGVGVGIEEGDYEYYLHGTVPKHVRDMLADPTIAKVGQKFRFDAKWLVQNGYELRGDWYCTKIQGSLINENLPDGLKDWALRTYGSEALEGKNELDRLLHELKLKHVGELCALDLQDETHPYFPIIRKYNIEDLSNTFRRVWLDSKRLKEIAAVQVEKLGVPSGSTVVDYYLNECMPLEKVLAKMELQGILVNRKVLNEIRTDIQANQAKLLSMLNKLASEQTVVVQKQLLEKAVLTAVHKCVTEAGKLKAEKRVREAGLPEFNWASGSHLGRLLAISGVSDLRKTKTGAVDTSEAYLTLLQEKAEGRLKGILATYADYKKTIKALGTYVEGMEERIIVSPNGEPRIHAQYTQIPVTGRLSSIDPNMQNLPRNGPIKKLFIPPPGHVFIHRDYSQVEMRVAADLSQDETMLGLFRDGADPHRALAAKLFKVSESEVTSEMRQVGKTCNFLLIFDGNQWRLQQALQENGLNYSIEDCKAFLTSFWDMYPRMREYLDEQLKQMHQIRAVFLKTGRIRRLPDIIYGDYLNWRNKEFTGPKELRQEMLLKLKQGQAPQRVYEEEPQQQLFTWARIKYEHAKKQGYNAPIQGFAASFTKRSMIKMDKAGLILATTVHDSIDEIQRDDRIDTTLGTKIMETIYPLSVPLLVDVKVLTSLHEKDIFLSNNCAQSA